MRTLQIEFTSGQDVLGHYWGFLSGGGLAIDLSHRPQAHCPPAGPPPGTFAYTPGETVHLEVHVCSMKKTYQLDVQVLEVRMEEQGRAQVMVSFLPHARPDELLDAAWADGYDAPQRRSRRLPARLRVRYECLDGSKVEGQGYLVNLSPGGCCIQGSILPPPGTQVVVITVPADAAEVPLVKLLGKVRWTERLDGGLMGIEFLRPDSEVDLLLQSLR